MSQHRQDIMYIMNYCNQTGQIFPWWRYSFNQAGNVPISYLFTTLLRDFTHSWRVWIKVFETVFHCCSMRSSFWILFKRQILFLKQGVKHRPGAIGEDQHTTAVEEAVLKLSSVTRPVAEGQLTQAMTQTCSRKHTRTWDTCFQLTAVNSLFEMIK